MHVYVDRILGSKKSFFVCEIITYEIKITFHLRNNYYEFSLNYIRTITNGTGTMPTAVTLYQLSILHSRSTC